MAVPFFRRGDRVRKRGQGHLGTISDFGQNPTWIRVVWDDGYAVKERPKIIHPNELEIVTPCP